MEINIEKSRTIGAKDKSPRKNKRSLKDQIARAFGDRKSYRDNYNIDEDGVGESRGKNSDKPKLTRKININSLKKVNGVKV